MRRHSASAIQTYGSGSARAGGGLVATMMSSSSSSLGMRATRTLTKPAFSNARCDRRFLTLGPAMQFERLQIDACAFGPTDAIYNTCQR